MPYNDMTVDIAAFHRKFGLEYDGPPRELPKDVAQFREAFLREEFFEYIYAKDLVGKLDALVDLVYVALGTAYLHGFDFDEAWSRVHEANMQKIRAQQADDSKRSSKYDVVKPEGWEPPVLTDLVRPKHDH